MTVPDHAESVAARYVQGVRLATAGITLVVLYGLELAKLLSDWHRYQAPIAQVAALVVLSAIPLVAWREEYVRRWRWVLIALTLAASLAGTLSVAPVDRLGTAHWTDESVGYALVLLSMDRPLRLFIGLLAAHYLPAYVLASFDGPVDVTFAGVVSSTTVVAAFQAAIVLFANVLSRVAVSVARVAREEEQMRTVEAVADQLHSDRKDRYAALAETTTPLLRGLGDGELDPGDESVRRACSIEAARMRRLFSEAAVGPDPLVDELMACVGLAERNGVTVRFSQRGDRPPVPTPIRRMLTESAVAMLATARGDVRLTVVGAGDDVTVSVVAKASDEDIPIVDNADITTSTIRSGDKLWVEATWKGGR